MPVKYDIICVYYLYLEFQLSFSAIMNTASSLVFWDAFWANMAKVSDFPLAIKKKKRNIITKISAWPELKHVCLFRVCIFLFSLCSSEQWSSGVWKAHRSPPPSAAFALRAAGLIYSWVHLSHPSNQQPVIFLFSDLPSTTTCDYFKRVDSQKEN